MHKSVIMAVVVIVMFLVSVGMMRISGTFIGRNTDGITTCFLSKTEGAFGNDYIFIQTDVRSDGTVSGIFNLVPAEKGSIVGTVSGVWTEQSPQHIGLDTLYTYSVEGVQQKEYRLFTMDDHALYIVWNSTQSQAVPRVACAQVPQDVREPVIVSQSTQLAPVTFTCKKQKTVTIKFVGVDKIELSSSDKGGILLHHVLSASGARYATPDESIVAWNVGNMLTVTEKGVVTYGGCTATPLTR